MSQLSEIKNLQYELAWVEELGVPVQLALAVAQRGVDDFQRFWLWVSGLEKAPNWFNDWVNDHVLTPKALDETALPRLKKHLELYSDAILKGHQVLLVSHSVGSFYANAALRALPGYVPEALQPSILKRSEENPYYPKTDEMVANVQVATPAAKTVSSSPWINFKDDQVLNQIRRFVDVLPGNVNSPGVSAWDLRGHSFVPSYLRVEESRTMILQQMKSSLQRLKYPIPFFKPAATIQYQTIVDGQSTPSFTPAFFSEGRELSEVAEKLAGDGGRFRLHIARCYNLRPRVVDIRAEGIVENGGGGGFEAVGWVGSIQSGSGQMIQMKQKYGISRWSLGRIDVSHGQGKSPIEAKVHYFKQPLLMAK